MKSIIQGFKECFFCHRTSVEEHHIFGGNPNRKLSEKYGLKVWLCHECHNEPPNGVHFNKERQKTLHQIGQRRAMEYYGWTTEEFIQKFGKNYLTNDMEEYFL